MPNLKDILKKNDMRLIVLIDDLDRLAASEARILLQLIKGLAGWRNTVFIIAYDRRNLLRHLDDPRFVDKIVQVEYVLHTPDSQQIQKMLERGLESLLDDDVRVSPQDWVNLYDNVLRSILKVPRDVIRLLNSCRAHWGSVRGEVDFVDFVGIQCLRVFYPTTFAAVESDPSSVVKNYVRFSQQALDALFDERPLEGKVEAIVTPEDGGQDDGPLMKLLRFLFLDSGDERLDLSRHRVRVARYTDRYFRNRIYDNELTSNKISMAREAIRTSDSNALAAILNQASQDRDRHGTTVLRAMLEHLRFSTFLDNASDSENRTVFLSLASITQTVFDTAKAENSTAFDRPLSWTVLAICRSCLKGLQEKMRFLVFQEAISEIPDLTPLFMILEADDEFRSDPSAGEPLFSVQAATRLKNQLVSRLKELWSEPTQALASPGFIRCATLWNRWKPRTGQVSWLRRVLSDDRHFASVVPGFSSRWVGGGSERIEIDVTGLTGFVGAEEAVVIRRARRILRRGGNVPEDVLPFLKELGTRRTHLDQPTQE